MRHNSATCSPGRPGWRNSIERRPRGSTGVSSSQGMRKYAIVIERGEHTYSAYVPDLPGCVTTGGSIEEIERNIREAIALHLDGLLDEGEEIPDASTEVAYVEVEEPPDRPPRRPHMSRFWCA